MLYRFVRAFNDLYGPVVLGLFILAFCVAFASMVYPIIAIVMIISATYLVVIAWAVGKGLRAIERAIARGSLRRGRCPACATAIEAIQLRQEVVHECAACRVILRGDGSAWEADPTAEDDEPDASQRSDAPLPSR